jgi:glucarate dehydratase
LHTVNPGCEILGGHGNVAARAIVRLTTADGFVGVSETYGNEQVISDLNRRSKLVERMDPYKRKPLELQIRDPMTSNAFETALYGLNGRVHGKPVYSLLGGVVRDEVEFSGYLF